MRGFSHTNHGFLDTGVVPEIQLNSDTHYLGFCQTAQSRVQAHEATPT